MPATNRNWSRDFIDVRKAHLNGRSKRRVAIKLPKQAGGGYGVLQRTLHGTRDAANAWAEEIKTLMINKQFTQGRSSPCLFWHEQKDLRAAVHGDDLCILGAWRHIFWFRQILEKELEITYRGSMRSTLSKNTGVHEVRILSRIVTLLPWVIVGRRIPSMPRRLSIAGVSRKEMELVHQA